MASAGKLFCHGGDVVWTAAAKAEFDSTSLQFNGDEGSLGAGNCEAFIDQPLGVSSHGAGFVEIVFIGLYPDHTAIGFRDGAAQNSTSQPQSHQRVLFVNQLINFVRRSSLFEEAGGNSHGSGSGGRESEPACVSGNRGVEKIGRAAVEADAK